MSDTINSQRGSIFSQKIRSDENRRELRLSEAYLKLISVSSMPSLYQDELTRTSEKRSKIGSVGDMWM